MAFFTYAGRKDHSQMLTIKCSSLSWFAKTRSKRPSAVPATSHRNFIYRPQKFLTTLPSASLTFKGKWLVKALRRMSVRGALASAWAMPGALLSAALSLPAEWAKEFLLIGPAREMHCTAALCRRLDWVSQGYWLAAASYQPLSMLCPWCLLRKAVMLFTSLLPCFGVQHTASLTAEALEGRPCIIALSGDHIVAAPARKVAADTP
jgi:hypothetical protein